MEKVHLIGNAHLDPVWLWRWQEGFAEIKATYRSALDRMNEFPDYKFTSACAAYYEWVKESDPKMFDEIKERIREGRWCITGGWYIQPDCNIPSGESFARHALISQRFFRDNFGVMAKTGYNVDSFGHNGSIPKLLRQSGMENYVFMRPQPHEKELADSLFDWESADGSSVRTYRIPIQYNFNRWCFDNFEKVASMASEHAMMAFYGIGNHGGGPTIKLLEKMERELDDRFIYSTPDEYFEAVKDADVPVLRDDLQYHAKGCYSACSMIKQNNRRSENMMLTAEKYSCVSNFLAGTKYPSDEYERAWKNILFNQFHDILGGCSIKEAYDDAKISHGEAQSIADRNTNFACQQISWNIDTADGREIKPDRGGWGAAWYTEELGTPVVIFNPHPWAVRTFVRICDNPDVITDSDGREIPLQHVRASRTNGGDKWECAFIAELPPLGYKLYRTFRKEAAKAENPFAATENSIENRLVKLTFNQENGELVSYYDKINRREMLSGETKTVLVDETDSDTWAHGISEFKKVTDVFERGSVKIIENGPVRATVRCITEGERTTVRRDYSLTSDSSIVTVKTKVDFREKHRMLKFRIPANIENPEILCEIPFGKINRPDDGSEQVCQSWFAAHKGELGLSVLNDSKYSFDADGGVLSLTVLRGAIFADHYGNGNRDEFCEYQEQGIHEFTYALAPFESAGKASREAAELSVQPFVVMETFHTGKLPVEFSGIEVSEDNIIVTAVKKHEDSDAYVLRAYESEDRDTDCEITLFGRKFGMHFGHSEVKTVILGEEVRECSFLEE